MYRVRMWRFMTFCLFRAFSEMLMSCLAIFVLAALYEGLKVFREVLLKRSLHSARYNVPVATSEDSAIVQSGTTVKYVPCSRVKSGVLRLNGRAFVVLQFCHNHPSLRIVQSEQHRPLHAFRSNPNSKVNLFAKSSQKIG